MDAETLRARIDELRLQYMYMGQEPPIPEYTGGDPEEYLTNLYYRDAGLATELAESIGLDRAEFLAHVTQVDQAAQDARGSNLLGEIGELTRVGRGEVDDPLDFFRDAGTLGAIGYATSFLPGGGAGAETAGTAAAGDGLAPITAGLGNPSAVMLPGANPAIPLGSWGGSIPAMASMPAAISTPAAISALTGVPAAAAPILDSSGHPIPGTETAGAALTSGSGVSTVADTLTNTGNAVGDIAGNVASGINWATLVPSIVSGVAGVLGANAQEDASADALALSERMFNIAREDALPRIQAGNAAVGVLDDYLGLTSGTPNMSRFFESPSYRFNLAEGTKAGERALGAMGLRNSGTAVKEAERYASGLASRESGAFVDQLLAAAGLGTTGAAMSASAGANNASIGGQAIQNRGAARSSGYGAVNDAVQGGFYNTLLQRYLNRNPVYA